MVLDELAKHFLVRRHAAGYTRGLQAWERPDFENKHRLALLTSAGFGSGWLPCSSLLVFSLWVEDSQERRSARERPTAVAVRSRCVYLGRPNHNKLQPGFAPEDWGHHCCGTFHPNNGESAQTEEGAARQSLPYNSCLICGGGSALQMWTGRMVHVPTPTPVIQLFTRAQRLVSEWVPLFSLRELACWVETPHGQDPK